MDNIEVIRKAHGIDQDLRQLASSLLDQSLRVAQLPFVQARILARHLRGDRLVRPGPGLGPELADDGGDGDFERRYLRDQRKYVRRGFGSPLGSREEAELYEESASEPVARGAARRRE